MKLINLYYFPKFEKEFYYDGQCTWEDSLIANGFNSAIAGPDLSTPWEVLVSDEEYTWFVLRWS
jgi:hypothetical protein